MKTVWHGGIKNRGRSVMRENSELRRAHCDVRELSKENIPHCWVLGSGSRMSSEGTFDQQFRIDN